MRVRWDKPQAGWFRLNSDGSASASSGRAGCGRLIRNNRGEWVGGFSRRLGCLNSFTVELWGLRDGLILCNSMRLSAVDIQLDAMALVQLLTTSFDANLSVLPLLDKCSS